MDRLHQKSVLKFVNLLQDVIIFSFKREESNNKKTIEEEAPGTGVWRLLSRVCWVSSHNKPVNMPPCFITLFSSPHEPEGGASSPTVRRSWLLGFFGWVGGFDPEPQSIGLTKNVWMSCLFILARGERIHLEDRSYLCLALFWGAVIEENCLLAFGLPQKVKPNDHESLWEDGGTGGIGRVRGKRGNIVSEWDVWHEAELSDLARPGTALALCRQWGEGWKE